MKQLCVVTMIGPLDLIGDLVDGDDGIIESFAKLQNPCMLHSQPDGKIVLRDMTKGNAVIAGDSLILNMMSVLWICEPSSSLRSAYLSHRAGILVGGTMPNKPITVDQLRQ